MNKAPGLSVIMSVYNGESYLEESVESVLRQTYTDFELIIINDCSTDKTSEILEKLALKDERIRVYTNEVNLKLPASLNKAVSLCEGKYILRMDSDDLCLPKRFEKQLAFMEKNKDIDLSSIRFLTLKNGVFMPGGCGGRTDNEALKAMLLVTNPILHPGVIAKKEVLKELKYDDTLTCTEDLELWTRMVLNNKKMAILPEYLLIYRLHDKQITSTTLERQHKEVLKVEERYYSELLKPIKEELKNFYISGIYFKENADIDKFIKLFRWIKRTNKNGVISNDALSYAFLEMLAEYKRQGISKTDILKGMLCFNPLFLAREIIRRKKAAKEEMLSCVKAAEEYGLEKSGGTKDFPHFKIKSGD